MTSSASLRNVLILAVCQAIFVGGQTIVFFIGGLIGFALAEDKALATLPVSTVILGTALATIPASLFMGRFGRRVGFMSGAAIGVTGAALACYAVLTANFWLFSFSTFLVGVHNAFCQYYRFAVADAAPDRNRARAISYVLAGGVVAGVLGPQLAVMTRDLLAPATYLGSYLTVLGMTLVAFTLVSFLRIPPLTAEDQAGPSRPILRIVLSRGFITAAAPSMISYAVMALLMTATPLAMLAHGFEDVDAGYVIQWHVVGMFGPSFLTGHLIDRFGIRRVMAVGAVLLVASTLVDLAGVAFLNFWGGLLLVGLGWNFLFIGGTTLLTRVYSPAERAKTQAANDFLVFTTTASASFLSGWLLSRFGWETINLTALALIAVALAIVLWSMATQPRSSGKSA